ncbi:hypothetical protein HMI55_001781 [Coelomomyces lativittatus]|nr:hypothetical protein HMI55_001781 [Coelomomyces lativittatus]
MRVLGSFIHSSSQDNPNVPFGGLCIELLVDEKHRITGAQFLDYMVHPEFSKGSSNILPSSNLLHMLMEGSSSKVSSRLSLLSTSKSSIKDATSKFTEFLEDLTSLGIKDNTQEAVLDILGAIYHLCLLKFIPSGSESNPTLVSNPEVLMLLSTLLHVPPEQLELILLSRTKEVKGERFTKLLSPDEALLRAKDFAETLYVLLFKWILEFINAKLTKKFKKSPPHTCISILHFPDFQSNSKAFSEWNDLVRYASDCFDFFSVSDAIRSHSFFAQYNVPTSPFKLMLPFSENPIYDKSRISTKHFNSIVSYDLLHLFNSNCASNFVQDLFRITSLSIALDEGRSGEIQGKPLRRPFLKVKKLKKSSAISTSKQLSFVDLQSALEELFSGMQSSHVHYFFCHFDSKVQSFLQQLKMFPNKGTFELFVSYDQLVSRYNQLFSMHSINEDLSSPVKVRTLLSAIKVKDSLFDATHGVWLSWEGMFLIEVHYRLFRDWKKASEEFDSNQDSYSESNFSASKDSFDVTSDNFDIFLANSQLDLKSDAGTARNRRANRTVSVYSTMSDQSSPNSEETFVSDRSPAPRKIKGLHAPEPVLPKPLPEKKKDPLRQRWVTLVKILTFWVPNILLSFFGKNSPESLMAWKEKFAIFMFIIIICHFNF